MSDLLSQKFAALADPTRRAMLARLVKGRASVGEIAEPFLDRMSLPAVTKHLQVLERAGLITKTLDAQRRLCELNTDGLEEAVDYLDQIREQIEASLDRLAEFLATQSSTCKPKKEKSNGRKK